METALIQEDLMAYQEATPPPKVSTALEATAVGGRPQSPAPTHGLVFCTASATMSTG